VANGRRLLALSSVLALVTTALLVILWAGTTGRLMAISAAVAEAELVVKEVRTLDEHVYTAADLPFFNESVAEYRRRLAIR